MSDLFKLNGKDFLNGFFTAIIGGVGIYLLGIFGALYQLVINGEKFSIDINLEAVLVVGIYSGLVYLTKRLASNKDGDVLTK